MTDSGAYLVLKQGRERFGLNLDRVEAVVPYAQAEPMPWQPEGVLGAQLYRGQFMGVVDLAPLLGLARSAPNAGHIVAVVEKEGGYVGFLAEGSDGILKGQSITEEARVLGRWEGPFLSYSVKVEGRFIHLLDLEEMIDTIELELEAAL